jgi:hypothetical protein
MPTYRIETEIIVARGMQTFIVEAKDEKDACEKHLAGKSDWETEEYWPTHLGPPRAILIKEE